MRQATGRINPRPAVNKVSIQLALDGHSFSRSGEPRPEAEAGEVLTVEILTPRTLLVPEALFAPERAAQLLAADGKAPLPGETTVWSAPTDGVVAVMALPEEALGALPGTAHAYTTPLLDSLNPTQPTLLVQSAGGYLYIKGWHAGLRLAEVLPAPTEADILYAVERLEPEFPAGQFALRVAGPRAKELAKLLKPLYPDTQCA